MRQGIHGLKTCVVKELVAVFLQTYYLSCKVGVEVGLLLQEDELVFEMSQNYFLW